MKSLAVKILMIFFWTVFALILMVSAALICTVRLLTPDRLTPVVVRVAEKFLDADVSVSKIELSFKPVFPVLNVSVDSLTLVSHAFDGLSRAERERLPQYCDTVLSLDRFDGAIDLGALISRGEIALRNVEFLRPGLNIVLDADGRGNFDIYKSDDSSESSESAGLPPLSISRFAFVEPREIRYFNAVDSTGASVVLLDNVVLDGSGVPLYTLDLGGHLSGPYSELLQAERIRFGLDGRLKWDPDNPGLLALEQFTVEGAFVTARLDAVFDYDTTLTVLDARLAVDPVKIEDMIAVLPDSLRRAYHLTPAMFSTDGAVAMTASLTTPFSLDTDTIPDVSLNISMSDCAMRYGKARFRKLAFDIDLDVRHNNLDSALLTVNHLVVAGPATTLTINGSVRNLVSDPVFDAGINGSMQLKNLPPLLADMAQGFISGRLNMALTARGRMSMLSGNHFHGLDVNGLLTGRDLYYLSNDTAIMADVDNLKIKFGSQRRFRDSTGVSSPTLAASIAADTASILIDGISITASDFILGAGVENRHRGADTTLVVPLGGALSIGLLDIKSITDSAGVRFRSLGGHVGISRYHGNKHQPLITAGLEIGRMSAGSVSSRFMLANAHLDASMFRRPSMVKRYKEIRHMTDSLSRIHPDLSPDSVYRLAIEKRRHKAGIKSRPRVHGELNADDYEILDWGLSKGMRKFMMNWQVEGRLTTTSARFFSPFFPLRNRINELDLDFSSDSVELNNVRCLMGNSDLRINGLISNIRKALVSKRSGNELKLNFDIESDTVDINQISAGAFSGSAYAERSRNGLAEQVDISADDDVLEEQLDALVSEHPDSVGPLLIPTNIDGTVTLHAGNVIYSDLLLKDLNGQILAYGGGINLHELAATSDAGNVSLSALYSAPKADDMQFGFGLQLDRFKIERFLKLVPAIDSIMPMIRDFSGIVSADIAATVDVDSSMNMVLPSLDAAIKLSGDSLAFINADTYRTLGKWLRFRDKADNKIKHMSVEFLIRDNVMETFPFSFDIDRYRLGVVGSNDLAFNFNYHISVLKSPLPFKFGINIKGNPDKYKVRFGGAKFKEGKSVESVNIVDTVRVNLVNQIENIFKRGVQNSRFSRLQVDAKAADVMLDSIDTGLSHNDSIMLQQEGILPPDPNSIIVEDDNKAK